MACGATSQAWDGQGAMQTASAESVSQPDFILFLSSTTANIVAGSSQSITFTALPLNGFSGSVALSLSGLPAGLTASPAALTLIAGTPQAISFNAGAGITPETARIAVKGSSGTLVHTVLLTLVLSAGAATSQPDFALGISPATAALAAGGTSQSINLSATGNSQFSGTVHVAIYGLPAGVTASPASLTLASGKPQAIQFAASASAAAGKVTVLFYASQGSLNHAVTAALTISHPPPPATVDVTTYHYDRARDGWNALETTLTPSNVTPSTFGKLRVLVMDGKADAAPLYLSAVTVNGQSHNVVYAASEHDSVYAFDADTGAQLWKVSVLASGETPSDSHSCGTISPEIGITATPVIDRHYGANGAIFLVAMTKDASGNYHQRLHALDVTTGAELSGSPSEIQATYPGTGVFSVNGVQTFAPGQYDERVSLLLMNGIIYLGWASHCDIEPYTGWLMAYSELTLKQISVLNLTPNSGVSGFGGGEGSIWMSGAGFTGDADGNLYFLDANGSFDATLDANGFPIHQDYGNAFLKVSTVKGKLAVSDYFNPSNTVTESNEDKDLGSGGVLMLPAMTDASGKSYKLAVGAGKDANMYIVDTSNMGKFDASGNHIYQQLTGALPTGVYASPAYFNGTIYYGSNGDVMKAFEVVSAKVQVAASSQTAETFAYPGTSPSVSSNGTQNGIVWAVENRVHVGGVLHAYAATDLSEELYDSSQTGGRDNFTDNKFVTPVVANGKVFIGIQNGVVVFGLLQ